MHCTPYVIGPIPFMKNKDRSINAPINPMIYAAVEQGFPIILLPEVSSALIQENPPSTPPTI
jgi:hypothetical protein